MQQPRIFSRRVFERAKKLPETMPEPFRALEEYDRTLKLRKWSNKVRVNFTIEPATYRSFQSHCRKHGYKMSTIVQRLIGKELKR